MLRDDEIEKLQFPLSEARQLDVIHTAQFLASVNIRQAKLLAQALDEVERLRSRVEFYRNVTIRSV